MDYKKEMGNRLKLARKHKSEIIGKKFTGQMLADALGVSRSFVGDMETGRTPIPNDLIEKIIEICELPKDFFRIDTVIGDNNIIKKPEYTLSEAIPISSNDVINIPIVGVVRAGQPILAIENIEGYFPALKSNLSPSKEYFYLRVKGDSMNLKFQEGSLLLVEKCDCIENGEIGVVLIDGLEATVKKVVINDNMITLIPMSTNPEHIPMMYDIVKDDVRIIGKAKMAINFL